MLVGIDLPADALPERFADVARQLSVTSEALHGEIDRAFDFVREAPRDQSLDDRYHLGHVIGGARKVRSREDPESSFILMETRLIELGDLLRGLPLGERGSNHLVLATLDRVLAHVTDVGDVLHRDDGVAEVLERPADPVRKQVGAQISEMGGPVDSRAAGVHPHLAGSLGAERDDAPLKSVVDAELHDLPSQRG